MRVWGIIASTLVLWLCQACRDEDSTSRSSAALAGSGSGPGSGSGSDILPASFAGTSTESGPGRLFDSTEPVEESKALTPEGQVAAQASAIKMLARDAKNPLDRGFAPSSSGTVKQ